ncbi:EF-hand domain-containing protein [Variovorax sp. GT1P44]|uniref:EF-hand domain-containing protein n=1 Tax=Variovorax sp. GT1P44 TaxID=3443742 RepID=UPI003F46A3A7
MKALLTAVATALVSLTALAAGGQPTEAEIAAAFRKADPDNDGTVSRAEAAKFGISRQAFDHANPDKDGTLDIKEFMAAVSYQFEKANPDKDGTLDRKEAANAGIKGKKTFDQANPDNDGTLDLSEYLRALTLKAK